jgi:hypothetical protein
MHPVLVYRPARPERKPQEGELRVRVARTGPAPTPVAVLAVHDLRLVRMQFQPDLGHPGPQSVQDCLGLLQRPAVDHRIVGIPLERTARELQAHPHVERMMQEQIRQYG